MRMQMSDRGVHLLKAREGLRLRAYDDNGRLPGGTWTIGYGHTGPDVTPSLVISEAEAERLLRADLVPFEDMVNGAVTAHLAQHQFDALVSFAFNVGPGKRGVKDGFLRLKSGRAPTLLRRLNEGRFDLAAAEFLKWLGGPAGTAAGLLSRRTSEKAQFEGKL